MVTSPCTAAGSRGIRPHVHAEQRRGRRKRWWCLPRLDNHCTYACQHFLERPRSQPHGAIDLVVDDGVLVVGAGEVLGTQLADCGPVLETPEVPSRLGNVATDRFGSTTER